MKKIAIAFASVLAIGGGSMASAQSISPTGSFTFTGSLEMEQSVKAFCNVSGTGTNTSTSGTLSGSFSPGNPLYCGILSLVKPYGAWSFRVKPGSTTRVYITVGANTVLNKPCYGEVEAGWNSATSTVTFDANTPIPAVNAGDPNCKINYGSVILSPARTIS